MIEYGVDTVAGPVPLPIRAKKIRPVKIVSSDGTVKRVTDTEAILPLMYRVGGLEVVTRDDADIKIVECVEGQAKGLRMKHCGRKHRCGCRPARPLCRVMRRVQPQRRPCRCAAYHFPHRRGGGACRYGVPHLLLTQAGCRAGDPPHIVEAKLRVAMGGGH